MGESVTIDWLPWARGFQSTRTGHYQATFPYLRTDERERDFLYSEALLSMPTFMWQRRGDTLDVDVPASFVGKVICVPLGFFSSLAQRLAVLVEAGQVRVERPQRKDSCVQMLAAGRVDALSGTVEEIGRLMEADGLQDKLVQAQAPLLIRPYFFIAPRTDPRSPQLIENFNAELAG